MGNPAFPNQEIDLNHTTQTVPSLTSLQIAELVEARHGIVERRIEELARQGDIVYPPKTDAETPRTRRLRTYTVRAYTFSGERGRRDSITVAAHLSPKLAHRVADRWQELTAVGGRFPVPMTYQEALRLVAGLEDERAALHRKTSAQLARATAALDSIRDLCTTAKAVVHPATAETPL